MKVLTEEGLKTLWGLISMEDYPNNDTLVAILDAIDATKLDKNTFDDFYNNYIEASKEDIENMFKENGGNL